MNDTGWGDHKRANFIECRAWGKLAENINKWFSKGDPIVLRGQIETSTWKDKNDYTRASTYINATGFDFPLAPRQRAEKVDAAAAIEEAAFSELPEEDNDDLPF